jgi:DNA-binding GntR family transcriptional regulator
MSSATDGRGASTLNSRIRRVPIVAAPLRKQVIELLRTAIISFEYEPGQRLVERELCERFEVSRTVIREVLRHLEAEGLIDLVPNRGPIVSITSAPEAVALYEVRENLEALAAACCAERASPAQKARLRKSLALVATAYKRGVLIDELAAKDEFYRVLCEGAANPVIGSMLRTVQARVQMLRGLSLKTAGRPAESLAELERVVGAIEKGDRAAASKLAADHVRNAGRVALQRLAEIEAHEGAAAAK